MTPESPNSTENEELTRGENVSPDESSSDSPAEPQEDTGISDSRSWRSGFICGMLCAIASVLCVALATIFIVPSVGRQVFGSLFVMTKPFSNTIDSKKLFYMIAQIDQYINGTYVGEVDPGKVADGAIAGYVAGLGDIYSAYYPSTAMEDVVESNKGEYVGIGVTVSYEDDGIVVSDVYEGTPAAEAGIKAGDRIVEIGGLRYGEHKVDEMLSVIHESEGESVNLTVEREGEGRMAFEVTPKRIWVPSVESMMLDGDIAYIALAQFKDSSVEQMREAIGKLSADNPKGLILDLRNNPGGMLDSLLGIADFFQSKDVVFYIQEKSGEKTYFWTEDGTIWDGPTVLLVDGGSASASEVLTGMMKDHGLATVVGTRTYGKGVVQSLFTLTDGSGLKLTTAHYFTPSGADINGVGIEPDILVEAGETEDGEDAQLAAAVAEIERLAKERPSAAQDAAA